MKSPEAGGHDNIGRLVEVHCLWIVDRGILVDEDDSNWYIFTKGGTKGKIVIVEKADYVVFKVLPSIPVDTAPYKGIVHNIAKLVDEGIKAG